MVLLIAVPARGEAHPFHITLAEVEYNERSGHLEIALRIYHPSDLETVLTRRAGRRVDLEKTENIDALIVDYLNEAFVVAPDDSEKSAALRWVGKEVSLKTVWLYFEIPLPEGPEHARITNRLLFEVEPDQVNTVNLRHGPKRTTLRFTREKPTLAISWAIPAEEPRDELDIPQEP